MGNLKEINSFKRRELKHELGKEGPNNWGILFKGKKTFWKVVGSKRLADKMVSTLRSRGLDAKVVITASPIKEKIDDPKNDSLEEKVDYFTLSQIKKNWAGEYPDTKFKFDVIKYKGSELLNVLSPKGASLEIYQKIPKLGWTLMENTQQEIINEGVDDPSIFKSVFLAGGPGSGKSFTVGKTGLNSLGYRLVNSDDKFEHALKKAGLEMTPQNV